MENRIENELIENNVDDSPKFQGLDFLLKTRKRESVDVFRSKVGHPVERIPIMAVAGTMISWASGLLYLVQADISCLPGNDINHNGVWDGELGYLAGYAIGFPAMIAVGSVALNLIGDLAEEHIIPRISTRFDPDDVDLMKSYSSLSELVVNDDAFRKSKSFSKLKPEYKDALLVDRIVSSLENQNANNVVDTQKELGSEFARQYAEGVIKKHLEITPDQDLKKFYSLLDESELVRLIHYNLEKVEKTKEISDNLDSSSAVYVEDNSLPGIIRPVKNNDLGIYEKEDSSKPKKLFVIYSSARPNNYNESLKKLKSKMREYLSEAENMSKDERISENTRKYLKDEIGKVHFNLGRLSSAERLWKETQNTDLLKGPLLEAYKQQGKHRNVAMLHIA